MILQISGSCVSDTIRLLALDMDRARSDGINILAITAATEDKNLYKLGTNHDRHIKISYIPETSSHRPYPELKDIPAVNVKLAAGLISANAAKKRRFAILNVKIFIV